MPLENEKLQKRKANLEQRKNRSNDRKELSFLPGAACNEKVRNDQIPKFVLILSEANS
jgi:hypothetical protein